VRYAIIGVEGPQDQAFVGKVLKQLLGFKDFRGKEFKGLKKNLDPFWHKFIPPYPQKDDLYKRLDMPSILYNDVVSVAIYAGEGSNLVTNLDYFIREHPPYQEELMAFGIVADADRQAPDAVVEPYCNCFRSYFPNFPDLAGAIDTSVPPFRKNRTGIYVLPDNVNPGVLETLLCLCGEVAYPEYLERAQEYLDKFSPEERKSLKWKPFDFSRSVREKALVATVVSVLKPGKTNTASIADNNWVSGPTETEVKALSNFREFLRELVSFDEG